MYFHSSNFRHEPKGLSLVFLLRESMFKNDKPTVLPQFKTFGHVERQDTDVVIIDMPHLLIPVPVGPELRESSTLAT